MISIPIQNNSHNQRISTSNYKVNTTSNNISDKNLRVRQEKLVNSLRNLQYECNQYFSIKQNIKNGKNIMNNNLSFDILIDAHRKLFETKLHTLQNIISTSNLSSLLLKEYEAYAQELLSEFDNLKKTYS